MGNIYNNRFNIRQLRVKSNESTFTIAKRVFISSEIDFMHEQSKVKFAVKQVINWRSLTCLGERKWWDEHFCFVYLVSDIEFMKMEF